MAQARKPKASEAAEAAAPEAPSALAELAAIEVAAKCERFRRAGRVFTLAPQVISLAELSEADLALLQAEPMLVVRVLN